MRFDLLQFSEPSRYQVSHARVTRLNEKQHYVFPRPSPIYTYYSGSPGKKRAIMAEGAEQKNEVEAQVEMAENDEGKEERLELQPEQETMRSVVLTGYGGIHKLQVQKYAKPKPMNGQVVVRVHAW